MIMKTSSYCDTMVQMKIAQSVAGAIEVKSSRLSQLPSTRRLYGCPEDEELEELVAIYNKTRWGLGDEELKGEELPFS